MFGENYSWNYDYVRLACDSGFAFQRYPKRGFDRNKICLIDIDRIVEEKDVSAVENYIGCVSQFVLDPEQAQILDDNFVKVFRLSQLIIDYLLFCKRHLDKTLTEVKEDLDKATKENNELHLFVEDLQQHVAVLMKEIKEQNKITYHCELCNKKFSTEEFLNSHIKRRHTNNIPPLDVDTDKLHMEIKELKGRLNSTEKLIQQEQNQLKPMSDVESDYRICELKKIDELQQKFEDLRVQVQSELKVLQTQYNFQEKYEKLFEKMALQNSNLDLHKREVRVLDRRRESTTQTEREVVELAKEIENNPQITELKEVLEVKVTTSLEKIENQMQSFWNKLHEMEIPKRQKSEEIQEVPSVKPRTKYTIKDTPHHSVEELYNKSDLPEETDDETSEIPTHPEKKVSEKIIKSTEPVKIVKPKSPIKEISEKSSDLSDTDTVISDQSEPSEKVVVNKPKFEKQVTKKRPLKSLPVRKKLQVNAELFEHFKGEVENIMVMGTLQDLGVSPEWKGLPTRSFQRALEIVNHKANLMKKTYPDYDKILNRIETDVNKQTQLLLKDKNQKNILKEKSDNKNKKIISVGKTSKSTNQLEIQNKKMYDSDSEISDIVKIPKIKQNLKELPYSAVIEELKTAVTPRFEQSDPNEEILKDEEPKGVLKNYPSVGSLTKKKVLFNLYNNDNCKNKNKEGDSTSITSSILDGSPKKPKKKNPTNDIEDLSDFDFSDV